MYRHLLLPLLFSLSLPALAVECLDVFTSAASGHDSAKIDFDSGAYLVVDNPVIDFKKIEHKEHAKCETPAGRVTCQESDKAAAKMTLPKFENAGGNREFKVDDGRSRTLAPGKYKKVEVNNDATLNVTSDGNYFIKELIVKDGASVNLVSANYDIKYFNLGNDSSLHVSGSDQVVLHVQDLEVSDRAVLNPDKSASQLTVLAGKSVLFKNDSKNNHAIIYAANDANLGDRSNLTGAVAAKNVYLKHRANITYDQNAVENAEFYGVCGTGDNMPEPVAHWPIDVCSLRGSADEVLDVAGDAHGTSKGGTTTDNDGRYCQAGRFDGDNGYIEIADNDSFQLPEGSVSLWFKADDFNGNQGLFSRDARGQDEDGHLTVWLKSNGKVEVRHQSKKDEVNLESTSAAANQWNHVVYTWANKQQKLYVNGELKQAKSEKKIKGINGNNEPIVLGANAWTTGEGKAESNKLIEHFAGSIDDVRLYAGALTARHVSELYQLSADDCETCVVEPELFAHWPMDVCAFNPEDGDVIDIVTDYLGAAKDPVHGNANGASIDSEGRYCQAGSFDGNDDYIEIPHHPAMESSNGTVAFWIRGDSSGNGVDQVLFSKDSTNYDDGGHLTIYLNNGDDLEVRHQTTNKSYTVKANNAVQSEQWHHVAYTWGSDGMRLYVDGNEAHSNTTLRSGLAGNKEPIILAAGATRSGNQESAAEDLEDYFAGEMDDVRFYTNQLNADDIVGIVNQQQYSCNSCDEGALIAFYGFEEADWSGNGSIKDSVEPYYNATPLGSAQSLMPDLQKSCQAMDVPEGSNNQGMDTGLTPQQIGAGGTISMWYRGHQPWMNLDYRPRTLFDATNGEAPFYLGITRGGRLNFIAGSLALVYSEGNAFPANQWVHIAATWDVVKSQANIYINGAKVGNIIDAEFLREEYIGANSIRIGGSWIDALTTSANGLIDDVRIYSYAQDAGQIAEDMQALSACSQVNHYQIVYAGQGLTCEAMPVTINACADENCENPYPGSSTVTLSKNGDAVGSVTFEQSTTMLVEHRTPGTVELAIQAANPSGSYSCQNGTDTSCNLTFTDAALQFVNATNNAPVLPLFTAEAPLADLGLRAVKDNQGRCEALIQGTQSVDIGFDCVNQPAYSSNICSRPFAGIDPSGEQSGITTGSVNLTFDSNGLATFANYSYADAGQISVTASATVDSANLASGATAMSFKPQQLVLSSECPSGKCLQSPHRAGVGFEFRLKAIGANGSDLPGYNPGALHLQANRTLPDDAAASEGQFYYADNLAIATDSPGSAPRFHPVVLNQLERGVHGSTAAFYDEAGSLFLNAKDTNYFGAELEASPLPLQNFTPAYFEIEANQPALADSCSPFTYIGQPFGFELGMEPLFTVTAKNARGDITRNYGGVLWKLDPQPTDVAYTDASVKQYGDSITAAKAAGIVQLNGHQDYDGVATIELTDTLWQYNKSNEAGQAFAPASEFAVALNMILDEQFFTDADNICFRDDSQSPCQGLTISNLSGASQRYGRLQLVNSYGAETQEQSMPMQAEYYADGSWLVNTDDNCSAMVLTQERGEIRVAQASALDITGMIGQIECKEPMVSGQSSQNDMLFDAPGAGNQGVVQVFLDPTATGVEWPATMNIDWNQDGKIDQDDYPQATATFGLFRGNDRVIHWREVFNN